MLKKHTYKSENTLKTPFYTKKHNRLKKRTHKFKKWSHNTFSH